MTKKHAKLPKDLSSKDSTCQEPILSDSSEKFLIF